MIEDMNIRGFGEKTKTDYIRSIKKLAVFLGRSPDTETREDIRKFQFDLRQNGASATTMNSAVSALRFFFRITLGRPEIELWTQFVREARKLPVILSPEEVASLIEYAPGPGLKYKAALSVAYGAGLRASEVVSLQITDIDSQRMLIRVDQGKGRKDRYVMLSPILLKLLRDWWCQTKPQAWLFPGCGIVQHITTRQLNRCFHAAAYMAGIDKKVSLHTLRHSFATHLLEQNIDIRVIQVLLGHAKLDTTALYTRVATNTIREVMSPLDRLNKDIKGSG